MDALFIFAFTVILYLLIDIRHSISKSKQPKSRKSVVMDSSALIDGRIVDIVKTGFLNDSIIVPKIILRELQLLADGRDAHKRERARLGLDVVAQLQLLKRVTVTIDDYKSSSDQLTDELVLDLAKKRGAYLCTTDFNLNKVAIAEGVVVLNVNELAQVMRTQILPNEEIRLKIIQKGESTSQGVGYLDDGTMVVVDGAFKYRGKIVTATVERVIQTKAGKMVFAVLKK